MAFYVKEGKGFVHIAWTFYHKTKEKMYCFELHYFRFMKFLYINTMEMMAEAER